jgi:hypothetical protein
MLNEKIILKKTKEITATLKKVFNLLKKKFISYDLNITTGDRKYIKHFDKVLGLEIRNKHRELNLYCCAFCSNLEKSICHENCFSCSKKVFSDCGLLLPGIFPFMTNRQDTEGNDILPWAIIPCCKNFSQLDEHQYFKNFRAANESITVAYYETLEGLYLGISHGKKPCHICASINIDIYNSCYKNGICDDNKSCTKILDNILKYY